MPKPERALSFMAHPDDAEIFCGGTLALLEEKGFEVHIASMTPGDCGSTEHSSGEIAGIRLAEARQAASKIGAQYYCADRRDLLITYDTATIQAAVEIVRQARPALVITHSPQDYLPDHEFTSLVVRNACFAASAPNFDTGRRPAQEPAERIPHLYYAAPAAGMDILGRAVGSGLYVDISAVMDLKIEMLACHKSQREWLRAQHGMDEYLEEARRWSAELGKQSGCRYAEGFRQHLGHPYPGNDRLAEVLGGVCRPADPAAQASA
jgi:N-acetylglucosamine malate deacetylase 1